MSQLERMDWLEPSGATVIRDGPKRERREEDLEELRLWGRGFRIIDRCGGRLLATEWKHRHYYMARMHLLSNVFAFLLWVQAQVTIGGILLGLCLILTEMWKWLTLTSSPSLYSTDANPATMAAAMVPHPTKPSDTSATENIGRETTKTKTKRGTKTKTKNHTYKYIYTCTCR